MRAQFGLFGLLIALGKSGCWLVCPATRIILMLGPLCLPGFVGNNAGAARHLTGLKLPSLVLAATDGSSVDLSQLAGRTLLYIYPQTGRPGVPPPDGWDAIPGARGCTPQTCGFRDHLAELKQLGIANVFGLSTQDSDYQREAVERLHLPFLLLCDADLRCARALNLPTFVVVGMTLLRRMAPVIDDGTIAKVFYPVFPPDKNAEEVIAWLRESKLIANGSDHGAKRLRR